MTENEGVNTQDGDSPGPSGKQSGPTGLPLSQRDLAAIASSVARILLVSSPDCRTLRAKDGPEQLFQVLGPSIFLSKRTFIVMNVLFE